jgi:myosin-5
MTSKRVSVESVTKVFIPDDEKVWIPAELLAETVPGTFDVRVFDPNKKAYLIKNIKLTKANESIDSFPVRTDQYPRDGFGDMSSLNYLHEASMLENLEIRFHTRHSYTYAGDICIAVNPYQWLDVYNNDLRYF